VHVSVSCTRTCQTTLSARRHCDWRWLSCTGRTSWRAVRREASATSHPPAGSCVCCWTPSAAVCTSSRRSSVRRRRSTPTTSSAKSLPPRPPAPRTIVAAMTDGTTVLPTIFMRNPNASTLRDPYSLRGRDVGVGNDYTRLMLARLRRAVKGEVGPTCWTCPRGVPAGGRARRVAVLTSLGAA